MFAYIYTHQSLQIIICSASFSKFDYKVEFGNEKNAENFEVFEIFEIKKRESDFVALNRDGKSGDLAVISAPHQPQYT